jgi:hypothetical protein
MDDWAEDLYVIRLSTINRSSSIIDATGFSLPLSWALV